MELPIQLQQLLPDNYSYRLKKWQPRENEEQFEAKFLVNLYSEKEVHDWWHYFNDKSNTTMRVRATCPKTGKVNSFKIFLKCLHQGRSTRDHKSLEGEETTKNTNCSAGMIIAIRRVIKYSKSKIRDPVDPVHPCEVQMKFIHNHPVNKTYFQKFCPVSKEVESKLLSLYEIGHTPITALEILKSNLRVEHGSQYFQIITNRHYCPDKSFCYRLYYKSIGKEHPSVMKKDEGSILNDQILQLCNRLGERVVVKSDLGMECAVVICTPLMRKAHALPQSGEVIHVEFQQSHDCCVMMLLTHTQLGGIPLGALVTTNSSTEVIKFGFNLLKEILPENAFYGKKVTGPNIFLVNDLQSQRTALQSVWPEADIATCTFRLLQSFWYFVFNDKNNVLGDHRLYLMYLAKSLLFETDSLLLNKKYQFLSVDKIASLYPQYLKYIESMWEKNRDWARCYHKALPLEDYGDYYQIAARTHRDQVLQQISKFNLIQILDFIINNVESYYKTKIMRLLHGKISHIFLTYLQDSIPAQIERNMKQISGNYFSMNSELGDRKLLAVDIELNTCSCAKGIKGILCSHQYWVLLKFPTDLFKIGFCDSLVRKTLFTIVSENDSILSDKSAVTYNLEEMDSQVIDQSIVVSPSMPAFESLTVNTAICNPPEGQTENNIQVGFSNNAVTEINSFEDSNVNSQITVHSKNTVSKPILCSVEHCFQTATEQENAGDIELSKHMSEVLSKFEHFCDRVKDGLKTKPKEFIPALEIMMKTLERNKNSLDFILSGLSFFGTHSGSVNERQKRKKRKIETIQEIIPRVYGHKMHTYSKTPHSHSY